jgi:Protein of unknown function (DUF1444)
MIAATQILTVSSQRKDRSRWPVSERTIILMRHFVFVLAAMTLLASPLRAEPLSRRAFTETYAAAVVKALPGAKVTIIGELLTDTRSPNGKTTASDLRDAYDRYLLVPADLDAILHEYVGVVVTWNAEPRRAPDRALIVPIFQSQRWLDGLQQQLQAGNSDKELKMLSEPYNAELTIFYVEAQAKSFRFLTVEDDVGDRAKLHELALVNLRRLMPKIQMLPGEDGIFIFDAGREYEASLLLANRMWLSGQIKVDGDIVAAAPIEQMLLITGSHNSAGLEKLRALAKEIVDAGPPALSSALFVYRDGKFVKFED